MIKLQIIAAFVWCGIISSWAQITVNPRKMPFYDVVEWPGNGVLLIAKDPKGNTTQQEVTYVNLQGEIKWQEQYLPQVKDPKLVLSEYSNYLYFLDQVQLEEGKIFYNQATFSGNIRKGSIFFPPIFRTIVDFDDVNSELVDVVNATDNLIFQFRLKDKKSKTFIDVLVLLNHYSLKTTAIRLPGTFSWDEVEKNEKSLPYFAGSKENENYFAHYSTRDKKKGVELCVIDKKGVFSRTDFFELPMATASWSEHTAQYLTGMVHLQYVRKFLPMSVGRMVFLDDTWFWMGSNAEGAAALWKFEGKNPLKLMDGWKIPFKKSARLGMGMTVTPKGLVWVVSSDEGCFAQLVSGEKGLIGTSKKSKTCDTQNITQAISQLEGEFSFFWNDVLFAAKKPVFGEQLTPVIFEKK
jgi:hypothetical protein